jgi:hypothetical protein
MTFPKEGVFISWNTRFHLVFHGFPHFKENCVEIIVQKKNVFVELKRKRDIYNDVR